MSSCVLRGWNSSRQRIDVLRTFTSEVPKASGGHERPNLFSRGKFLAASWPIDLVQEFGLHQHRQNSMEYGNKPTCFLLGAIFLDSPLSEICHTSGGDGIFIQPTVEQLRILLPPLHCRADRPQEVAVAFRLLRQIRPAAFIGRHLVVLFQLEFVRNIRNWQPQYKLISWMLTWGPWPAAPSCLSSWWPPCLWCLHLCLPRHPAVSPTLQQPPLQRASCHSLLCSQPWQRKAVLELPVVYLNRCREKINTHDMNKAAWLNSLYLNVFYLLATDGASYQMPAGLHDATQLAFPAGLCSVGKRVAGGGQFHLPWQEVKIWRWMLGSLEVKLIFCLWSANQLQIRDLSVQFLADKDNLKWTAKKRGGWHSDLRGTKVWYLRFVLSRICRMCQSLQCFSVNWQGLSLVVAYFVLSSPNWMCAFTCLDAAVIGLSSW